MNKGSVNMKYLPDYLLKQYEQDLKLCHPIEGLKAPLINYDDVLQAHYILADYFLDDSANEETESMMVGLLREPMLASALGRQIVEFNGKQKYSSPIDICATLFYGLVKDHAFRDGNKRTALLVLLSQLYNYGFYPKGSITEFEKLVLSVAENSLSTKYAGVWKKFKKTDDPEIQCIAYIIRKNTSRVDRSFHVDVNMREFCAAITDINTGVTYKRENMKIKFERKYWICGIIPHKLAYTVKFYGETRPVEAKMARDVFDALRLTEEYASFQDMINGNKPLYKMINQFEVPFRRLKDE